MAVVLEQPELNQTGSVRLERLLLAASAEARTSREPEVSPRSLFAAVFDLASDGVFLDEGGIRPLDAFARPIVEGSASEGLAAMLEALRSSATRVGRVLREQGLEPVERCDPWSREDEGAVRRALAPQLTVPVGGSELTPIDATQLQHRASRALVAARQELLLEGVEIAILSGHRSTSEQAEDYALITSFVDPRLFPVAPAGHSLHERGLAVDVSYAGYLGDFGSERPSDALLAIRRVMRRLGWFQFDRTNDPFHFSFGRVG